MDKALLRHVTIGLISGYAGTRAMTPVTTKLSEMESPQDKEQEKRVSPGVSYTVAARQIAESVGVQLSEEQESTVGTYFHLGLGLAAGEMYEALRHGTAIPPLWSGTLVGLALFAGIDEGLTPAMGWSAPASAYPPATHLRGLLGHLALGFTVAATAELLHWLTD